MDSPAEDPRDDTIGDLLGRLIEDGRNYARAEISLVKQIARHRAGRARNGLIAVAVGGVLLLASLIGLVLGLVLGLAVLIGPVLAGLAVAALFGGAGYLLVRAGLSGLRALGGGEEEKQALLRGESLP